MNEQQVRGRVYSFIEELEEIKAQYEEDYDGEELFENVCNFYEEMREAFYR